MVHDPCFPVATQVLQLPLHFSCATRAICAVILALMMTGCARSPIAPDPNSSLPASRVSLRSEVRVSLDDGDVVTFTIAPWMFFNGYLAVTPPTLTFEKIAAGLGVIQPDLGLKILEPINVIWVDFMATDPADAKRRLESFFAGRGFSERSLSSGPYWGYYYDLGVSWVRSHETFVGGGTWADGNAFVDNSHGRLFPSLQTTSARGSRVFVTTGAFSKEYGGSHNHFPNGFNIARDELDKRLIPSDGWSSLNVSSIGNEYSDAEYTTADHNGARIFVAQAPTRMWIHEYIGSNFNEFSCERLPSGGSQACATPRPGQSSYTTANSVSIRLTLFQPLPARLSRVPICVVLSSPCRYELTASDGRQTLTMMNRTDAPISVSTDAAGSIIAPWQIGVFGPALPPPALSIATIINRPDGVGNDYDVGNLGTNDFGRILNRPGTWRNTVR